MPNPLPPRCELFSPVSWDKKKNEILFVGRICPEKRVDLLIEMWSKVKNHNGWRLVIVGDGESLSDIRKLVTQLDVKDVDFVGFTNTPEQYYKRAKYIVLTSRFEGFGMSLIEEMNYGDIPVAFNVSAGVESIVVGAGGFLIRKGYNKKFRQLLSRMVSNSFDGKSLSQKAVEESYKYTLDVIGQKWVELINAVAR